MARKKWKSRRRNPSGDYTLSVHVGTSPAAPSIGSVNDLDSRRAGAVDAKRLLRESAPGVKITEFWRYKSGKVAPAIRTKDGYAAAEYEPTRDGRMNKYPRVEGYTLEDGSGSAWVYPSGSQPAKPAKVLKKTKPKVAGVLENPGRRRRARRSRR